MDLWMQGLEGFGMRAVQGSRNFRLMALKVLGCRVEGLKVLGFRHLRFNSYLLCVSTVA